MRFSIKWALATMAYVALAVSAIALASRFCASLGTTISALSFCYASVVAHCGLGRGQATATGFIVLSALLAVGIYVQIPFLTPHPYLAQAGYFLTENGYLHRRLTLAEPSPRQSLGNYTPAIHAANAIAILIAGFIGCGLGALAYRRCQSTSD